jgi:polyisoprenoid-binding protein YceI
VVSLTTNNPQRDNDLRSSYFLELDKYPTITFTSTRIEPAGEDRYTLSGDLTIKGITRPGCCASGSNRSSIGPSSTRPWLP